MIRAGASSCDISVTAIIEEQALPLLASAPSASWRQYPGYASVAAEQAGAQNRYLLVKDGADMVAVANVRIKRVPFSPFGLAMIAQGPVMLRHEPGLLERALQALAAELAGRAGLTLRINPPVATQREQTWCGPEFAAVRGSRYETFLVDLLADDATLRARLDGKWRTDLRRGEKSEVEITRTSDPADFRRFQPLLRELAQTKGFAVPQDADFFAQVASRARPPEDVTLHLAWHKGRLVGGHVGAFSGDLAVYLVGAVNDEGRDLRASFLLQWAVMRYARDKGLERYDLGGIDQERNPEVYRFKKRMGGAHYLGPPMVEVYPGWPNRQVVQLAERLYAWAKR